MAESKINNMDSISRSKEISIYDLSDSLWNLFLSNWRALAKGVNNLDKGKKEPFTDKQYLELMVIPMVAIMWALTQKFGDIQEVSYMFFEIQNRFFERYFKDSKEKESLEKLFLKRYDEYTKIINDDPIDSKDQFKQLFRINYFGEMKGMNDFRVMMYVSTHYSLIVTNIKEFLDVASLKFKIV